MLRTIYLNLPIKII